MKTLNTLSLSEGAKLAGYIMGSSGPGSKLFEDWNAEKFIRIKNAMTDLLDKPDYYFEAKETIKGRKWTYKLNYDVCGYSDQLREALMEYGKDFVNNLHFLIASIAQPLPGKWFAPGKMPLDEIAKDLLRSNFLEAYSALNYLLVCIRMATTDYKAEKIMNKLSGKGRAAALIERPEGMFITIK